MLKRLNQLEKQHGGAIPFSALKNTKKTKKKKTKSKKKIKKKKRTISPARAHRKALGLDKHYVVKKPTKTHRVLSYVFVGGISFWIGNEYAKKSHHKSSYKKRPYGWERSK